MSVTLAAIEAREQVWDSIRGGAQSVLVDSPPGAGKSTLVREIGRRSSQKRQTPIVVQTNEQADDMVRGFDQDRANGGTPIRVGRLRSSTYVVPADIHGQPGVTVSNSIGDLHDCDVVVAPAAKWAYVSDSSWPFAIIDEAYQMRSDALLPIGAMAERLLLVGDPGQLAPFTTADDTQFRGRPLSPTETAAATILTTHPDTMRIALPVSWRLPTSAASVVSDAFYQQPFTAGTAADARRLDLGVSPIRRTRASAAVETATDVGWAYIELDELVMPKDDPEAVEALVEVVGELLARGATVNDERGSRPLTPRDVAVGVTHRSQRDHVVVALRGAGLPVEEITVDTANSLQGREFEVVVVWHPLSGRRDATQFHLDAGRLCVLLSRHRQACIVVSRAGIRDQLNAHPSTDPVWLGEVGPVVDGWGAHLTMLDHLDGVRV